MQVLMQPTVLRQPMSVKQTAVGPGQLPARQKFECQNGDQLVARTAWRHSWVGVKRRERAARETESHSQNSQEEEEADIGNCCLLSQLQSTTSSPLLSHILCN